ncbi:MAG: hypothetical protein RI912_88, partial [Actinomycetota bacterium]
MSQSATLETDPAAGTEHFDVMVVG